MKSARERLRDAARDLLEKASDAHAAGMVLAQRSAMVAQLERLSSDAQAEELARALEQDGFSGLTDSLINSKCGGTG